MKNIQIKLNRHDLFDIQITDNGGGTISSTLKIPINDASFTAKNKTEYNVSIDALESLILGHACAGIKVDSDKYIEGLETAIDSITAHYL